VCAQLRVNIYKEIGVKLDNKHRYDYVQKSVETNNEGKVTILWNLQVQTDRTIPNKTPDIIIRDNKQGTCIIIIIIIIIIILLLFISVDPYRITNPYGYGKWSRQ
jgi:hypothetical protein